jgi:hypothetical protein
MDPKGDSSVGLGLSESQTVYLGGSSLLSIPMHLGKKAGKLRLVFTIPQAFFFAGGSPPSTPHIWGCRATRSQSKPDEFSPIQCLYPQFFASYPQFCRESEFWIRFEEPHIWGVTSGQKMHPRARSIILIKGGSGVFLAGYVR